MRILLYIFLFLSAFQSVIAQNFNVNNERTFEYLYQNHLDTAVDFHAAIKPYNKKEVDRIVPYDTTISQLQLSTSKGFINQLFNQHLIEKKGNFTNIIYNNTCHRLDHHALTHKRRHTR